MAKIVEPEVAEWTEAYNRRYAPEPVSDPWAPGVSVRFGGFWQSGLGYLFVFASIFALH